MDHTLNICYPAMMPCIGSEVRMGYILAFLPAFMISGTLASFVFTLISREGTSLSGRHLHEHSRTGEVTFFMSPFLGLFHGK